MKHLSILIVCLLLSTGAIAQTVMIQECKDPTEVLEPHFSQSQASGWAAWNSSAKSTATGLFGARTEYSDNSVLDATYAFWPEYGGHDTSAYTNFVAFDSGKNWDVYITTPAGDSIDATNSVYIISTDGTSADYTGTVPLVGFGDPDTEGPTGNKWYLLESNVSFAALGGYVEVQEGSPQGNRFYADSVMFTEHSTGPTPTPTITPTPRATAVSLIATPSYLVDDGDAGFSTEGLSWFALATGYGSDCFYRDNKVTAGYPVSATANWSFTGVATGTYDIGFYLPVGIGWDYTKYLITCGNTALDTIAYGNQTSDASDEFKLLLSGVSLDGDVSVIFVNRDDGINLGNRMYADAMGIFQPSGPTATPTDTPIVSGVNNGWRDYR